MFAATANDSIPAWKASLLEQRRRQQQSDRGPAPLGTAGDDGTAGRLVQMPAWKREIHAKKGAHSGDGRLAESTRGPPGRNCPQGVDGAVSYRGTGEVRGFAELSSDDDLSDSERLLPIHRNPILQSDIRRRPAQGSGPHESSRYSSSSSPALVGNGASSYSSSSLNQSRSKTKRDNGQRNRNKETEVDEVTYGRGFVSKLLGRFRELSERNHSLTRGGNFAKRACSSENILEAVNNDAKIKGGGQIGGLKFSKGKAQSMENLSLSSSDNSEPTSRRGGRPLSILNGFSALLPSNRRQNTEQTHKKGSGPLPKNVEPVCGGDHKRHSLSVPASPATVVRGSSPAPEDELPRSNMVLLTRTVFESIAVSPPIDLPNSKNKMISGTHPRTDDKLTYGKQQNRWTLERDEPDNGQYVMVEDGAKSTRNKTSVDVRYQDDRKMRHFQNEVETNNSSKTGSRQNTGKVLTGKSERSAVVPNHLDNSSMFQNGSGVNSLKGSKSEDRGRNGYVVGGPIGSPTYAQLNGDLTRSSETGRPIIISDLKDLPANVQITKPKTKQVYSENRSAASTFDEDPSARKGPGSLLIRPASNLMTSSTKVEYLNLTKYNNVKTGDFVPPKQRPSYYDDLEDDSMIPVRDFDESTDGTMPPKEGDPTIYVSPTPVFKFEGAGVRVGRSLLEKTKTGEKLKIRFDDAAEQIFEYPSEQAMIKDWVEANSDDESEDDPAIERIEPNSILKSSPGINATGSLSSYKTRLQVDYEIGVERPADEINSSVAPSSQTAGDGGGDVTAADVGDDDSVVWSNSSSNDLLF